MKKAIIIYNRTKSEAFEFYKQTKLFLEEKGVELLEDKQISIADFMIVLGGDGTLLAASKRVTHYDIPIIAINLGSLGFLTEIRKEEAFEIIENFLKGNYQFENRKFLEISLNNEKYYCLNEVVLSKGGLNMRMVSMNLYADDIFVNNYKADGVIISTPTGSTAYSLSAGGPIINPNLNLMTITPIAPHTWSARPIIVDGYTKLGIESTDRDRELHLILDGQVNLTMTENDSLEIKMSQKNLILVKPESRNYYQILREKLKWGDNLC